MQICISDCIILRHVYKRYMAIVIAVWKETDPVTGHK